MAKFRVSKVFSNAIRATPVTVHGQLKGPKRNIPREATKSSSGKSYRSGSIQRRQPGRLRQGALAGEDKASEPWSVKFLADRIDGFKFDHSPLKVTSKWLTPSDRLENSALEPTDAQRHIIELGRSSVARHGAADAALQALTAAVKKNTAL
jgi:hypothetical protein